MKCMNTILLILFLLYAQSSSSSPVSTPPTPDSTFLSPQKTNARQLCCYVSSIDLRWVSPTPVGDFSGITTEDCGPGNVVQGETQYGDLASTAAKKVFGVHCILETITCGYADASVTTFDSTNCKPGA